MSDRFIELKRLSPALRPDPQAPVTPLSGLLLQEQETEALFAVLKLSVGSAQPVTDVLVRLYPKYGKLNATNDPLEFRYSQLQAAGGSTFGAKVLLPLPALDMDGFSAEVAAVRFADGSAWHCENFAAAAQPLPGDEPVYAAPTPKKAPAPAQPAAPAPAPVQASAPAPAPVPAVKQPTTEAQLRNRRRALFFSGCGLGAVALALAVVFLLVPMIRYSSAAKAAEEGDYAKAESVYLRLDDYRDSRSRSIIAGALGQINEGDYEAGMHTLLDENVALQVNYDLGEGRFADAGESTQQLLDSSFSALPPAERDYYQFAGWTLTDSSCLMEKDGIDSTLSFQAQFTPITYSIHFENMLNGTVSAPREYTVESDDFVIGAAERTGYSFKGWSGDGEGMEVTIPSGSHGDLHFRANWEANKYTVKFDAKGEQLAEDETASLSPTRLTFDAPYSLPRLEKRGYTFLGWTDGTDTYLSGSWTCASDLTLTPVFELTRYSITYDYADGELLGENPDSYTMQDKDIEMVGAERFGYKFLGWTYDGGETQNPAILPSGSVGDKVFTAVWQGNPHTVYLNANGGSGVPSSYPVTFGSSYSLPTPTKTGYNFTGWSAGGTAYTSGTWAMDDDLSVTAGWTARKYNITLNANGGTGVPSSTSVTYDSSYSLPTPTRKGYDFSGWTYGGQVYSGGTWKTDGSITLTAQWVGKRYTVSLNANGGSVVPGSMTVVYGDIYTLPTPTRVGYTFTGWSTSSSSSGSTFASSGYWSQDKNLTLYAKWEVKKCTITMDHGTGRVTTETVRYGSSYYLSSPSRTGYTFDGWYYNGMPFDSSGTYNIDGDITVVARWTGKTYTVYLNANSGTGVPGSVSVIYGSVYSLPTPTRDGYSFDGWYTSRNGGSYYSSFGTWNETSGKTLYAHWTKLPDSE